LTKKPTKTTRFNYPDKRQRRKKTVKKNAVGRILYQKVPVKSRIASWNLPARIICLLLALIVWLMVSALGADAMGLSL
jgi:hypothetical protein